MPVNVKKSTASAGKIINSWFNRYSTYNYSHTFTANGTFIVPNNVSSLRIHVWGGGADGLTTAVLGGAACVGFWWSGANVSWNWYWWRY